MKIIKPYWRVSFIFLFLCSVTMELFAEPTVLSIQIQTAEKLSTKNAVPRSRSSQRQKRIVGNIDYFRLAIDKPLSIDVSVDYQTRDGTAKEGIDYVITSGIAIIPAGQASIDISVNILIANSDKTFSLVLTNPKGAEFPEGTSEIVATHTITTPNILNTTITGYIENNSILNAVIKLTDENSHVIVESTSDANGKYKLKASFIEGEVYTLKAKSKIGDRDITLHSTFRFSSDTTINVNPLTELKYQLVQSGKKIEEAETLIRDYFFIVNGQKLERNRFDIGSSLALGIISLAKLYDGKSPIDVIEKIKKDILRNDGVALEDKEYSFKDLLRLNLELEASSNTLKVGENLTISLLGADDLNENYLIEWLAIPNDNNNSSLTKTFTVHEPKDIVISVNIYLKDDKNSNNNILLSTQSVKVNFYKIENSQNIEITGNDVNVSIGSDVKINIPANALSVGQQISYSEVTTNSSDYLKVFNLEPSGIVFSKPIEIRIKYDPSQVYDPRLLSIKRISSDGKEEILKVKEINYANSELIFETEHFSEFRIESDLNMVSWGDTSFEKWDKKENFLIPILIRGLSFPKNTPYHYLAESLHYYCSNNNINNIECKTWLKYFRSKKVPIKIENKITSSIIEESFKEFFNEKNNYDIFSNNYNTWLLTNKSLPFPYMNSCYNSNAKGCYERIKKYTFNNDLEGNKRKFN